MLVSRSRRAYGHRGNGVGTAAPVGRGMGGRGERGGLAGDGGPCVAVGRSRVKLVKVGLQHGLDPAPQHPLGLAAVRAVHQG